MIDVATFPLAPAADWPAAGDTWPLMTAEQAQQLLRLDMRRFLGVPVAWGADHEVIAATHDPVLAFAAADALSTQDLQVGYLTSLGELGFGSGFAVDGPVDAVLVGTVGGGPVDWRPASSIDWSGLGLGPAAAYAVTLCRVRPARAWPGAVRLEQLVAVEDAAEQACRLAGDDRLTCHTCRAWATAEHIDSTAHHDNLHRAAAVAAAGGPS